MVISPGAGQTARTGTGSAPDKAVPAGPLTVPPVR
jgi:hypothetical protein